MTSARSSSNAAREEAGKRRLAELLLGQRVVTEIVYAKKVPVHFLEAAADGKRVVLHGVANTQAAIDAALAAARSVPGVCRGRERDPGSPGIHGHALRHHEAVRQVPRRRSSSPSGPSPVRDCERSPRPFP